MMNMLCVVLFLVWWCDFIEACLLLWCAWCNDIPCVVVWLGLRCAFCGGVLGVMNMPCMVLFLVWWCDFIETCLLLWCAWCDDVPCVVV